METKGHVRLKRGTGKVSSGVSEEAESVPKKLSGLVDKRTDAGRARQASRRTTEVK